MTFTEGKAAVCDVTSRVSAGKVVLAYAARLLSLRPYHTLPRKAAPCVCAFRPKPLSLLREIGYC